MLKTLFTEAEGKIQLERSKPRCEYTIKMGHNA